MRVSSDEAELAEASAKVSERIRSEQQVVIDNFVTFSRKALVISGNSQARPESTDPEGNPIQRRSSQCDHAAVLCPIAGHE